MFGRESTLSAPIAQIGEIKSWFRYFTTVSSDVESAQPKLWSLAQMGRAPKRKLEKPSATHRKDMLPGDLGKSTQVISQDTKWMPHF